MLLALALVVGVSIFTGCVQKNQPDETSGNTETQSSGKPEVTISWFFNAGGVQLPDDGYIVNKIKEDLNISFKHIKPKTNNYEESLNLIIASGDIPDLIQSNPTLTTRLISDGLALQLEKYLTEEYIPNVIRIQKNWNKAIEIMTRSDGHIYAIPNTNNQSQSINMYIRYDWLENLGLEVPKDFYELRDVLVAFTNSDPDKNSKDDTVGTMINEIWAPRNWSVTWGAGMNKWYRDEDGKLSLGGLMPQHKEWLKYMRSLIETGALHEETLTTKLDKVNEQIQAGKVGFSYGYNDYNVNDEIGKVQPDVKWAIMDTVKGPVYNEGYVPGNNIVQLQHVVSMTAEKKLDRIWDLYNYFADDKTTDVGKYDYSGTYWTMKLGEKGVNWDLVDGKLEVGNNNEKIKEQNKVDNWTAVWSRVKNQFDFAHLTNLKPDLLEQWQKFLSLPTTNEIPSDHAFRLINAEGLEIPQEMSEFMSEFDRLWSEMYGKAILGYDDIDNLFDGYIKQCNNIGYQAVRDAWTELARSNGRIK